MHVEMEHGAPHAGDAAHQCDPAEPTPDSPQPTPDSHDECPACVTLQSVEGGWTAPPTADAVPEIAPASLITEFAGRSDSRMARGSCPARAPPATA